MCQSACLFAFIGLSPSGSKYQAALEGGHDVFVLISEVWGGFSPEAMRFHLSAVVVDTFPNRVFTTAFRTSCYSIKVSMALAACCSSWIPLRFSWSSIS